MYTVVVVGFLFYCMIQLRIFSVVLFREFWIPLLAGGIRPDPSPLAKAPPPFSNTSLAWLQTCTKVWFGSRNILK